MGGLGVITFLWSGNWEVWPQQSHYLTWRGILLLPGIRPSACPEISHSTLRTSLGKVLSLSSPRVGMEAQGLSSRQETSRLRNCIRRSEQEPASL